jgi:hypothetical protein
MLVHKKQLEIHDTEFLNAFQNPQIRNQTSYISISVSQVSRIGHHSRYRRSCCTRGLASMVRAPGPCLPSKFRLLVLTAYLPAGILSSFIARQAEQPAGEAGNPLR